MNISEAIRRWWRDQTIGIAPEIIEDCVTGFPTSFVKGRITIKINSVIAGNKKKFYKFGKTGHALTRTDQEDYRTASHTKMYLLYKSKIPSHVESLERYYCIKHSSQKWNKNVDIHSSGKMKTIDGYYFLYLVV